VRPLRTAAVAVSLLLLVLATPSLAGCSLVGRPDASGWDQKAQLALDDAASEVGTARLALRAAHEHRTWSGYTTVLVADAEKAAATAEEDLSRLQVPSGRADAASTALDLLGRAADATRQVRAMAVAGRYDDPALEKELARLAGALQREATRAESRG